MNRIIRLFTIGILSVIIFGIASTQDVLACSPYGTTVEENIHYADFIVRGVISYIDDSNKNGILAVTEYLKGEGEGVILLSSYAPRDTRRDVVDYRGGCNHGMTLVQNTEIIMFLSKNLDGSYAPFAYYSENQRVVWSRTTPAFVISLDELGEAITYYDTQLQSYIPRENYRYYPLFAPLLITTQTNSNYLFPVDRGSPILLETINSQFLPIEQSACWKIDCTAISLTYTLTINHLGKIWDVYKSNLLGHLNGDAFLLSPWAPFVAVWWESKIQIFRINPTASDEAFTLISEKPISIGSVIPNSAAWSPNENIIAFSDDRGIMLWDVFTEGSEPVLIYETDTKTIQGFSPLGRFLVIGDDENGVSIDLISNDIYPVGVFSPMEDYLLSYNTQMIQFIPPQIQDMIEIYPSFHQIQWVSDFMWLSLACDDENNHETCVIIRGDNRNIQGFTAIEGYDFDYDMQNRLLAVVINDYELQIEQTLGDMPLIITWVDEYNLSPYLDSPIASIEWLPSLFYYDD